MVTSNLKEKLILLFTMLSKLNHKIFFLFIIINVIILDYCTNASFSYPNNNEPILVTSDNGMESSSDGKICKAKGNVKTKKGSLNLNSKTLITKRNEQKELVYIEAIGNVKFINNESLQEAYADKISFDIKKGILKLENNAKVIEIKKQQSLSANVIIISLKTLKDGYQVKKIIAKKNVKLILPKEKAFSDEGEYFANTELVILTKNVKILNDNGIMEGDYAKMNLKTGISKVLTKHPNSIQTINDTNKVQALLVKDVKA